ncbi:MAG: hypothetical protein N2544_08780 [Burkholderiales bacterium]|nr:hypothetical protein [Burkholderiales bacterium]
MPLPPLKVRLALLVGFTALAVAVALFAPAVPQPLDYHDFADQRPMFGVVNFLDVASNAGFLLAGLWGLGVAVGPKTAFERPAERWPYAIFFVGLALTAAGSAYYHLVPDNERLFWDRLPMTVAFMALVAAQIVDRISVRVGLALLAPALLVGAASVIHWIATERAGQGNLVPYGVLQAYAVLVVLAIAVLHPSRYTHGNAIYWAFGAYVAAKVLETFDRELFALGHVVSGHSLKHLAAAASGFIVLAMLIRRRPRAAPAASSEAARGARGPAATR